MADNGEQGPLRLDLSQLGSQAPVDAEIVNPGTEEPGYWFNETTGELIPTQQSVVVPAPPQRRGMRINYTIDPDSGAMDMHVHADNPDDGHLHAQGLHLAHQAMQGWQPTPPTQYSYPQLTAGPSYVPGAESSGYFAAEPQTSPVATAVRESPDEYAQFNELLESGDLMAKPRRHKPSRDKKRRADSRAGIPPENPGTDLLAETESDGAGRQWLQGTALKAAKLALILLLAGDVANNVGRAGESLISSPWPTHWKGDIQHAPYSVNPLTNLGNLFS